MTARLKIERYPKSSDKSLQAWSAADELILSELDEIGPGLSRDKCIVLHDLFGYLTSHLHEYEVQSVVTFESQKMSIQKNLEANDLAPIDFHQIDEDWGQAELAVLKIPKSIELFRLYLAKLTSSLSKNGTVLCGFMTRNFTPALLKVAGEFFESVEQSRATKKSRLLILKVPKPKEVNFIESFIGDNKQEWKQYVGVFSAGRIDLATRFLVDNLKVPGGEITALDVGSGNGVIAGRIQLENSLAEIHLMDDNRLAVLSGELNVQGSNVVHHWASRLDEFEMNQFDLIVTNPPFHFEYEVNMDVALHIFQGARRILKDGGQFWVVANNNLRYKPELLKYFKSCEVAASNGKFNLYCCE